MSQCSPAIETVFDPCAHAFECTGIYDEGATKYLYDRVGLTYLSMVVARSNAVVMNSKFFSLKDQYRFYSRYHVHPTNIAIHVVFVPLLHLTALIVCFKFPWFDLGAVSSVLYVVYYFVLDTFLAFLLTPYFICMYILAKYLWIRFASLGLMPIALVAHFTAWLIQFLGHHLFERNKPALFDSLVSSLLTAPLFVVLELVFWLQLAPSLEYRVSDGNVEERAI